VGIVGGLTGRIRAIDPAWVDRVAAVVSAVGAIADAAAQPHLALGPLAVGSLVVMMSTIAWRRTDPVRSTLVAVSGVIVFEAASRYNGDGAFEVAAVALNYYTLGRLWHGRASRILPAALLAYWLVGTAVLTYVPPGGTVGKVLGPWALVGVLPFAVGRALARRRALADKLAAGAARLEGEQELGARRAAAEEPSRMARELHDVIAHCVSVMVVQTGAARRVARADIDAARQALRVVEGSGREALVELRRIVGAATRQRRSGGAGGAPSVAARRPGGALPGGRPTR
jgi:signal transduction histidine kinase